ncbi:MAG: hypothetical protein H6555_04565 [Lewinellaceae bacterium]|nr:hypothetical protein [Lewinellaceae bacterium]
MPRNLLIVLLIFFLGCCFLPTIATAAKKFEYTPRAREAYELATSLRIAEARAALTQLKFREPNNLIAYHIENYLDFFVLFTQERSADYDKLRRNEEKRIEIMAQGDPNSPYYAYVQADTRLQWALIKLKFGDYLGAFTSISKAHKLLKRNQERFPGFLPNLKDLGILHAMIGTIPDNYKWGVRLLSGLRGTIAQGRKELEYVLNKSKGNPDFLFAEETLVIYSFVLLHLDNKPEEAWVAVNRPELQPGRNPLHTFVKANVGMRAQHNDEAIRLLEQRPSGKEYAAFPYLDFMQGLARLRRLDRNADNYFQRFLEEYRGRNFIKEAYQKMAWSALITGNTNDYTRYMAACLANGHTDSESDETAEEEARKGIVPHPTLLRARLLFDGGYYIRALETLQASKQTDFASRPQQLEYTYRYGRILHGLERWDEAIKQYNLTIDRGRNDPDYFACNAALQAGLICEKRKARESARQYFETCLSMRPSAYRTSMHQAAKAGLNRLGY